MVAPGQRKTARLVAGQGVRYLSHVNMGRLHGELDVISDVALTHHMDQCPECAQAYHCTNKRRRLPRLRCRQRAGLRVSRASAPPCCLRSRYCRPLPGSRSSLATS
jgi:hypothetical protein